MSVNLELLKKNELIELVEAYKAELATAGCLLKDYAENNFADEPMHKVASAMKYARIEQFSNVEDALRIYRKDKEHQEFMNKLKAKRGY